MLLGPMLVLVPGVLIVADGGGDGVPMPWLAASLSAPLDMLSYNTQQENNQIQTAWEVFRFLCNLLVHRQYCLCLCGKYLEDKISFIWEESVIRAFIVWIGTMILNYLDKRYRYNGQLKMWNSRFQWDTNKNIGYSENVCRYNIWCFVTVTV